MPCDSDLAFSGPVIDGGVIGDGWPFEYPVPTEANPITGVFKFSFEESHPDSWVVTDPEIAIGYEYRTL